MTSFSDGLHLVLKPKCPACPMIESLKLMYTKSPTKRTTKELKTMAAEAYRGIISMITESDPI